MSYETQKKPRRIPVIQLSIFSENKVGRLHELIMILNANNVHIMGICSIDNTDSSVIRIIVDYIEYARALLEENNFMYSETEVLAVEIGDESNIKLVTSALMEAEINIHYIYSLLMRPSGKTGLIMSLEDTDLAKDVLKRHNVNILGQDDITR